MTASELLELMQLGRYSIAVNGDSLHVSPSFAIDDEMAELIKLHKAELINLLVSKPPRGVEKKLNADFDSTDAETLLT